MKVFNRLCIVAAPLAWCLLSACPQASSEAQAGKPVVVKGAVTNGAGKTIRPSIILSMLESQKNIPINCNMDGTFTHKLEDSPLPKEIMLQFFYAGYPVRTIRFLSGKMPQYLNVVIHTNEEIKGLHPQVALLELSELQGTFLFISTAHKDMKARLLKHIRGEGLQERIRALERQVGSGKGLQLDDYSGAVMMDNVKSLKTWSNKLMRDRE